MRSASRNAGQTAGRSPGRRPSRPRTPDVAELHRRWLELVDTDGPFLAVPPLKRVWPQGIPEISPTARMMLTESKPALDKAWDNWDRHRDDDAAVEHYRTVRDEWVRTVLADIIGWGNLLKLPDAQPAERVPGRVEGHRGESAHPSDITASSPTGDIAVHPTGLLRYQDNTAALLLVVDACDSLRDPISDGWAASPIDRMESLLRAADVPIGVVTDGRWWGLVCARPDAMVASGIVNALDWIEESEVRNAFLTVLQRRYLVGGKPENRLPKLFEESVAAAEEITEALGVQVRRAVELLINAFSENAVDDRQRGESDPLPANRSEVYQAAVTVMMRVVFLLFAEERSLLPQSELFTLGYGISGELDDLDTRRRMDGVESLDSSYLSWHRLLATTQALYAGATFEDIRLPSYGGSVFDPERFPFLSARTERGTLRIAVSDRVMLEVFNSVQVAQLRGQPARRISFRDVDVEQIGYIYEGLLGYTCTDVTETTVGLIGSPGSEPEIGLSELESLVGDATGRQLAEQILASVKQSQPAAKPPTKAALAKALTASKVKDEQREEAERALLAVSRDEQLRDRLRPFIYAIRRDLRGRPMIIQPGGLLVTETPSRATSGAHYTPRSLAEEIVEHALEPLVFRPGPHQTSDRDQWSPISSDDILELKVADIACGSGAFLVAAARYLAARLVEAWQREGEVRDSARAQETHAIRQVVANCLYGADINPMAVEMCKLSLWLVSLDPKLPFSFVDDKILTGNSLLGLTDVKQLRALHIYPGQAPSQGSLLDLDIDAILERAAQIRRRLASEIDNDEPQRSANAKQRQLREYRNTIAPLTRVADGITAAGISVGGGPGRDLDASYDALRLAITGAFPPGNAAAHSASLDSIVARGLTPTVETDYKHWRPLHWLLAVPDVLSGGGFDAVVGNPPFLGGKKITGSMGTNVRNWLVNVLAAGQTGSADLIAYFILRAWSMLSPSGTLGIIATNTVAQGDTREVGLDRLVDQGFTITRSIQSRPWPAASANLEFAAVWGTKERVDESAARVSDGILVPRISTLLEPASTQTAMPARLAENAGLSYIGCFVCGKGFVLDSEEAKYWISRDSRYSEVLFPYLNGEDINSQPDAAPSRWTIDFFDMSLQSAATYQAPFERVEATVKPERLMVKRKALRDRWWQYADKRPALRRAISRFREVLVIARLSRTVMPIRVPTGPVFSDQIVVFATDSYSDQAVLSSSMHQTWAIRGGSSFGVGVRYTPSDVLLTFPMLPRLDPLAVIGRTLDNVRREVMLRRNLGLTKLYNLVNDPDISNASDADVARMREIHVELDQAVAAAYGWDLPLDHGFHTYRQMTRWTVSPAARVEILDRLLEENHRRAAKQGVPLPSADDDEDAE